MRRLVYCLLFVFAVTSLAANDVLRAAEKAYDSRQYGHAAELYRKLVDEGYRSPELYFNLGNSYYRNNQLGLAIYYYELSRKLAPNDEDVRINLGIASSKTVDKIDSKENFFINAVKTGLLTSFSTKSWAVASIVFLVLGLLAFFVFVDSSKLIVKRLSFGLSAICTVLFIISYLLGLSALNAKSENKFAIILERQVNVMNEPTSMAKSKFSLHEGTKVRVVENNGDWMLIKLDNGNEGWLKRVDVGVI